MKRQNLSHRRPLALPTRASAPDPSRISHADELQLACRLAECRRELLALALESPAAAAELRVITAELGSGARAIEDLVELEGRSPAEAAELFHTWVQRVERLQSGPKSQRPNKTRSAAASASRARRLVQIVRLEPELMARLITRARENTTPELAQRMATLEAEVDRIRSRFVEANQGLVHYVAQRYLGMGLVLSDLMQEGNIGLLRAIEKFDHRRGGRFGTYAIWWVRQGIRRALANQSRTIRIPVHALGTRYTLDQAAQRLSAQLGRAPTEGELTAATGVGAGGIAHVAQLVREPLSLDAPRGPDSEVRLGDAIADPSAESAADHTIDRERAKHLRELLRSTLSQREREMLRMRFGLDGSDECTLDQIGRTFAVTRERVRQIVDGALHKLERQTRRQQLDLASF